MHDRVQNFSGSGLFSVEVSGSGFEVSGLRVFGFEKFIKILTFFPEIIEN